MARKRIVYVMRDARGYIKIGIAQSQKHVSKRRAALQTGNPFLIEVLHTKRVWNAATLEKRLHKRFERYRMEGEWFRLSPEMIEKLLKL
jgi:myo-inositol catabolism protein IolC